MYNKPLQADQCSFCGIIGTDERPVKYHICSVCKDLRTEFPKRINCLICGHEEVITFKEHSRRGNCCEKCDARLTEKVKSFGYPTIFKFRGEMKKFLGLLKK